MKTCLRFAMFFALGAVLFACATTGGSSDSASSVNKEKRRTGPDYSTYTNLADILRTKGSLQVLGVGQNVRVYIRGVSSIMLNTQPLYIIDKMPIGQDYNMANSAINPREIKAIRVLRDKTQTTIYGEQGANGVILIETNRIKSTKEKKGSSKS